MPESLLRIITSRSTSEVVIKLSGECDISNVECLNATIYEILLAGNRRIVLDVEDLNFMGSCVLTSIERAVEHLQQDGGIVVIKRPSSIVRRVLDIFAVSERAVIVE